MAGKELSAIQDTVDIPHWYSPEREAVTITRGDGSRVFDEDAQEYLDFVSQLYCVNAGHGNETIIERIDEQLNQVQYVSSSVKNDTRSALAKRIASKAPERLTDVVFSVTGSEANELAAQFARDFQDSWKILTTWQSYHGSTYGTAGFTGDPETRSSVERYASVTGQEKFLPPLEEDGAFAADTPEDLAKQAADHLEFVVRNEGPDSVAAILIEPVGGTSGAYPSPADYLTRVREICDTYDILMIADEVITGFGRCGDWFAIEADEVTPDMITFAKGVTSGYVPLGGVILAEQVAEHFREEGIPRGQTFGGHPVACAAGLGAMDAYEDGLMKNVEHLSPHLEERLQELSETHDCIHNVRGQGFFWSIQFRDPKTGEPYVHPWIAPDATNPVDTVRREAAERGLLVGAGRPNTQLILSPPFTVWRSTIDEAMRILDEAISETFE